jgi:hypothetical protein
LPIALFEEAVDRGLKVGDGSKDAARQAVFCGGCEEALDGVEPGSRGRGEVERPSRIAFEPSGYFGMLVSGVVVDAGVNRPPHWNLFLDDIEEADELLMTMALNIAARPCSVENVHCSEQRRRAMPLIVMRHSPGAAPFSSGSPGCCNQAPESGSFRRPTGRWRGRADRPGAANKLDQLARVGSRVRLAGIDGIPDKMDYHRIISYPRCPLIPSRA